MQNLAWQVWRHISAWVKVLTYLCAGLTAPPGPDSANWTLLERAGKYITAARPHNGALGLSWTTGVFGGTRKLRPLPFHLSLCRHCCHWGGTSANVPLKQHELNAFVVRKFTLWKTINSQDISVVNNYTDYRWALSSNQCNEWKIIEFSFICSSMRSDDDFIELWCADLQS